jgi:two-component system, cell cycle sensor histidine kinase and response regulator CckA
MLEQSDTAARILIVEDELIVSADIAARLKRMGYKITGHAESSENAMLCCAETKPDLVLMDIRIKGAVDGISTADKIRIQYQVPVVFLTAHADEPTLRRARVTEPFGYVLKPFEERELKIAIEMSLYRAKSQRQLNQSRAELAAILCSIGDAVIATDDSGNVSYLNPVAERLTCFDQGDAKGVPFSEIATCHDLVTDAPLDVQQLLPSSTNTFPSHEVRLRTRSGREYVVIASVTQLPSVEGLQPGNVLVFRDVSQQRRLEEELKQAQRMEALGHLAVGIAHDLNNILTVICVNHSLLEETIPSESMESELLKSISQAADRASKLTQQLLAIGKNQMVQPRILNLDAVIQESLPFLKRLLTENIHWHYQPSNCPLPILADQIQVEQILLNLLINARNAMPAGGVITLRTSYIEDCKELRTQSTLSAPASASTPAALIEVEDTGCGMDEDTQKRIWEPFYSSQEKGIGLGLAVVYGAVKQAGGTVSLVSEKNKGSVFRVFLPVVTTSLA